MLRHNKLLSIALRIVTAMLFLLALPLASHAEAMQGFNGSYYVYGYQTYAALTVCKGPVVDENHNCSVFNTDHAGKVATTGACRMQPLQQQLGGMFPGWRQMLLDGKQMANYLAPYAKSTPLLAMAFIPCSATYQSGATFTNGLFCVASARPADKLQFCTYVNYGEGP